MYMRAYLDGYCWKEANLPPPPGAPLPPQTGVAPQPIDGAQPSHRSYGIPSAYVKSQAGNAQTFLAQRATPEASWHDWQGMSSALDTAKAFGTPLHASPEFQADVQRNVNAGKQVVGQQVKEIAQPTVTAIGNTVADAGDKVITKAGDAFDQRYQTAKQDLTQLGTQGLGIAGLGGLGLVAMNWLAGLTNRRQGQGDQQQQQAPAQPYAYRLNQAGQ